VIGRADALMAKSQEALESARADLEAGRLSGASASSRAYYALFHAARAALEAHGIETNGRRHGTIIRRFSLTCVKAGLLDPVHGRNLNKALEIRREGDYDLETPDQESVATAVRNASAFVEAITALIEQVGQP
jgi:uncharacterized protein (UPF0332 family)